MDDIIDYSHSSFYKLNNILEVEISLNSLDYIYFYNIKDIMFSPSIQNVFHSKINYSVFKRCVEISNMGK